MWPLCHWVATVCETQARLLAWDGPWHADHMPACKQLNIATAFARCGGQAQVASGTCCITSPQRSVPMVHLAGHINSKGQQRRLRRASATSQFAALMEANSSRSRDYTSSWKGHTWATVIGSIG